LRYALSLVGLSSKLADVAETILLTLLVLHLVLLNFANITSSPLYFDITKDCLNATCRVFERRAVVTTLARVSNLVRIYAFTIDWSFSQVLDSITAVMAPVLPYLAKEIHRTLHEGDEGVSQPSVLQRSGLPSWVSMSELPRFSLTFSLTA
jgi:isoleucyl-tRNA synthetase